MITSHTVLRARQNYDYNSRFRLCIPAISPSASGLPVSKPLTDSVVRECESPGLRAGALRGASVAAPPVGTGPDQRVGVRVLVVEEVGVDGAVERRVVQLEAQIVAALVGALGPGGPDLDVKRCTA